MVVSGPSRQRCEFETVVPFKAVPFKAVEMFWVDDYSRQFFAASLSLLLSRSRFDGRLGNIRSAAISS